MRQRGLLPLVAGVLVSLVTPVVVSPPARAVTPGCRTEPLGPGWTDLVNCSAAPVTVLRPVLESTDAYRLRLISPADRFLANNQWLVWIDVTRSPGTMRGLWPLTSSGAFAGISDPSVPGGGFKSLVAVGAGFGRPNSNPVRGYRGTHVEIWRTPGSWYYTYRRGPPAASHAPVVQPDEAVSTYSTPLVDTRTGSPVVEGVNGVQASMNWTVNYVLGPTRFVIGVEVAASADVDFTGDLGGLLLLTNPACRLPGNYGRCGHPGVVSSMSLHRVEAPASDDLLWNRQITPDTDQYLEVRNSSATWALGADMPGHNLMMSPSWSVTDPHGQAYTAKAAYHYNSRASDVGGLNGFGSLDVVLEAPPGGSIAVGPTRGVLRFGAALTHRAAEAEAEAAAAAAMGELFALASDALRW